MSPAVAGSPRRKRFDPLPQRREVAFKNQNMEIFPANSLELSFFFARLRLCMAELGMINHDCLIIHIQYSLESTSRMGSRSLLLWSQQNRCCRKPTKQMSTLW